MHNLGTILIRKLVDVKLVDKSRLFVLIIYLIGLVSISTIISVRYIEESKNSVDEVTRIIEDRVSRLVHYYQTDILPSLPAADCDQFLEAHNHVVFHEPYVRSYGIVHEGTITCNSVSGSQKYPLTIWTPDHNGPRLFYSSYIPFMLNVHYSVQGMLVLRLPYTPSYSVNFALYSRLFDELIANHEEFGLKMHIENADLDGEHRLIYSSARNFGELFTVTSHISTSKLCNYVLKNAGPLLLFWTLIIFFLRRNLAQAIETFNLTYWQIKKGLKANQFEPYFQPVFDADGKITGAEVLVRWIHPRKGMIPPYQFIDTAEKSGQVNTLTSQLMRKCADYFQDTTISSENCFNLGFNVSASQLDDEGFFEDITGLQKALSSNKIQIIIELTERQAFLSQEKYATARERLKSCGVIVALDDFGTGYCSMSYLLDSDVDIIKIDRSFIRTIDEGPNTNVLDSIIELAKRTQSLLLAEGIETQAQFDYLKSKGVKRYQGFLFEKPISVQDFKAKYTA